jgi:hypothetical protein
LQYLFHYPVGLLINIHQCLIDDQLEQTNAGLVGKSMPNFGDINKELAKECKEEFEVEVESESDRKPSAI